MQRVDSDFLGVTTTSFLSFKSSFKIVRCQYFLVRQNVLLFDDTSQRQHLHGLLVEV